MYAGRSSTAAHSWHVTACGKVVYVICGRWPAGRAMQICLFVTLRVVKRTAIMHVHEQPIPVEVALTPDLHESCLVIATLVSEPMAGSKKTDRNNNHCDV
jgi:hypothetical protein